MSFLFIAWTIDARKAIYVANSEVGEVIHYTNGEIGKTLHKYPFAWIVGKRGDFFDIEVGKRSNYTHIEIGETINYFHSSA